MNPQIQSSLDRCRAAWAAHPDATYAWCCHHELLSEKLTESYENRIQYILSNKAESEQAIRLDNFRPITNQTAYDQLYADYRSKCDQLDADYWSKRDQLYRADVPLGTWNGKSIF